MLEPLLYTVDPQNYSTYLNEKIQTTLTLFDAAGLAHPSPEIHASAKENFRSRAEFCIFKEGDTFSFSMFKGKGKDRERISLFQFPMASKPINMAMTLLIKYLPRHEVLYKRVFSCEFLSSRTGEVTVSLNYRRPLDEATWLSEARSLKKEMSDEGLCCDFIGRAHKQQISADTDSVLETLNTDDGGGDKLYEVNGTFSQPNAGVACHMVSFARSCAADCLDSDLLELYCGSGTFTVCLADRFSKVLATEVARIPTKTAFLNLKTNNIKNVKIVRLSAEEVSEALNGVREFFRLKEADVSINDYNFKTLLIDPPRCGLNDERALSFTAEFDRVIYISCNPVTLIEDLKYLTKTHDIERLAFFDQFPYTPHLESGVLLKRRV